MGLFSWILSKGEKLGSSLLSEFLWPPCSASVVVLRDGKLLAVRKDDFYMLPGGMIEKGESFREAAVREAREETGFEVEILERLEELKRDFGGVEVVFLGRIESGEPQGSWEGCPEFIPVEEAGMKEWRWERDVRDLLEKADAKR